MGALTFADMTTGPAGQPMTLGQRTEEVQRRYRSDDPVPRAIVRAGRCSRRRAIGLDSGSTVGSGRPAVARLADLGQRWTRACRRLLVATGVVGGSVVWLFGAVGPAQPDQPVFTEEEVTVQAPSGGRSRGGG
jgi:hypothetical protein